MTHAFIGKEIGNYRVLALLGEGGMGAVLLGEHRFLGDKVAIKVLHGSYAHDPNVSQRFFQEARAAREIGHPNIVGIVDFGQQPDGMLYLVMELLEGQSLAARIRQGALPEDEAAAIAREVCAALAAAHAKGIVHRDLKPDNVFLTRGRVKVVDFGIAKVLASSSTQSHALLGTPAYMAPEQARGAKFVGPHTDVYALGVMLFEMMTGRPPFSDPDFHAVLAQHMFEPPPRPSATARVSGAMEELILACLGKEPAGRPTMAAAGERLAGRAAAPAMPKLSPSAPTLMPVVEPAPAPVRQFAAAPPAPGPRPTTTLGEGAGELAEPRARPRSPRLAIAAVLVAGAAGGGGWLLFHPGRHVTPDAHVEPTAPAASRPGFAGAPGATDAKTAAIYARYVAAVGAHDSAAAFELHAALPADSPYYQQAAPTFSEVVRERAAGLIAEARMLPHGRCDDVRKLVAEALALDPVNPQAAEVTRRCDQPEVSRTGVVLDGESYDARMRSIASRKRDVAGCYNALLKQDPTLEGRLEVNVIVHEDGTAAASVDPSSALRDDRLRDCITLAASHWKFAKRPGAGDVNLSFPFNFVRAR